MDINNPIQIIPVFTRKSNSFIIRNSTNCLLIDTGMPSSIHTFMKIFKQNKITPEQIDLIIITHTHNDHCGNAAELKRISNAKVMVHIAEVENLRSGYTPFPAGTSFLPGLISRLANRILGRKQQYKPVEPDIVINELFDLSEFGFDGYVLPVPGHTRGSLCVILKNEAAFVGDTMFNILPNSVFPPFANDTETLKRSWYKIFNSGASIFFPGHGKSFDLKKFKKSLDNLE